MFEIDRAFESREIEDHYPGPVDLHKAILAQTSYGATDMDEAQSQRVSENGLAEWQSVGEVLD